MKPPKWHRDEIILALDLYYNLEPKEMDHRNLKVIELSEILNKLPIHKDRKDNQKFRNPNGVGLKLSNFKAIDPDFVGKGMDRYSKLDKEVFYEFIEQRESLKKIANQIKQTLSNKETTEKLYRIQDEEDDEITSVKEGRVIYKLHKLRERDAKINKKKKDSYLRENGKLDCEVCGFEFFSTYGDLGNGFIEAHHRVPLSDIEGESKTELKDLALVCSNCHRMLHREIDTLTIKELKKKIKR
jgi:5-methylcytosine-specific restriction protein A